MSVSEAGRLSARVVEANNDSVPLTQVAGRTAAVFFMRAATCPVCRADVRSLVKLTPALDALGVGVVVVVPGDLAESERIRKTVTPAVTVVSSGGTRAHDAAGLGRTLFMRHSGTVLLEPDGSVRYALTSALPTGSFDAKALLVAAQELATASKNGS